MVANASPFFAAPGTLPRGMFRPQIKPAPREMCFQILDDRATMPRVVPPGTILVWDVQSIAVGFVRPVKGRYSEVFVPLGHPEPALPEGSDPKEWQPALTSGMYVDAINGIPAKLRELRIVGAITPLNVFHRLYTIVSYKREAQEGRLPVLLVREEVDSYENSYGTFGLPVLEILNWMDRDEDLFGPAIIRPPSPVLPPAAARAQLPNANDNGGSTPVVAPATTPATEAKPANDRLAGFRPVAGKTPY